MPWDHETQTLINDFHVTLGMIKFCKETGSNPQRYIKQAKNILEKLKKQNFAELFYLKKQLSEKLK